MQQAAVLKDFDDPGVSTFVVYGSEVPTPGFSCRYGIRGVSTRPGLFMYDSDFASDPNAIPSLPTSFNLPEAGDGYVPLRSALRAWYEWATPMNQV